MIQTIARAVSALLSLYMLLIFIRILLTWFSGARYGRAYEILAAITDPYLEWFRRNVPVRFGVLDFSPLVGILILGIIGTILSRIALVGTVTVGYVLAVLLSSIWSVISFFLMIFIVFAAVRVIGLIFNMDHRGRIWSIFEQFINPVLQQAVRPFLRGRFTSYRDSLFIFLAELIVLLVAGRFLIQFLISMVLKLPF